MFEKYTERARRVLVLAQDEDGRLNHNYVGTEHLLLGLIREPEGIGGRALESLDVGLDVVRGQVRSCNPAASMAAAWTPSRPE